MQKIELGYMRSVLGFLSPISTLEVVNFLLWLMNPRISMYELVESPPAGEL